MCRCLTYLFKHRQPKVAEVSLFQIAEPPTNMYDYTLPQIVNVKIQQRQKFNIEDQQAMITLQEMAVFNS